MGKIRGAKFMRTRSFQCRIVGTAGCFHCLKYVGFDEPLGHIVYLSTAWLKDLDTVVVKWIMRGTNDNPGVKIERSRQIGNTWRRYYTSRFAYCTFTCRTGVKCLLDPFARLACIATGNKSRIAAEIFGVLPRKRRPYFSDRVRVERKFAGKSLEKFSYTLMTAAKQPFASIRIFCNIDHLFESG